MTYEELEELDYFHLTESKDRRVPASRTELVIFLKANTGLVQYLGDSQQIELEFDSYRTSN